jgi:hypothetical protein
MKNKCCSKTKSGFVCKNKNIKKQNYCSAHIKDKIECSICLDYIHVFKKLENCNHIFCKDCIYNWLSVSPFCPYCRTQVSPDDYNLSHNYNIGHGNLIILYTHYYSFVINEHNHHFYDYLNERSILFSSLSGDMMTLLKEDMRQNINHWNQYLSMHKHTNVNYINLQEYEEYYNTFKIDTTEYGTKYFDIYFIYVN